MHVCAIVLAAGRNERFKSSFSKLLAEINSKPIIIYSLQTLNRHRDIKDIIVVANSKNLKDINKKIVQYQIRKVNAVVLGGRERQDSVYQGLKALKPHADIVLIHDGARPFINNNTISTLIKEATNSGAAIAGLPVKATIKTVGAGLAVKRTLNRDNLWEIQTPQVFKRDLILKAYKKFGATLVTDDASLVEKLGAKVKVVKGCQYNIKITTPEDLTIAEEILKVCKS